MRVPTHMIVAMIYLRTNSYVLPFLIAVLLLCVTFALHAGRDAERESLKQLAHQINQLESLITKAESASDPSDRVRFRYDWLRSDVAEIQKGIEAFLADTEFSPRSFRPLQAEYHQ